MKSPRTVRELVARIRGEGYTVAIAASGHYNVRDAEGHLICALPCSTRNDANVKNAWTRFQRKRGTNPRKAPSNE